MAVANGIWLKRTNAENKFIIGGQVDSGWQTAAVSTVGWIGVQIRWLIR